MNNLFQIECSNGKTGYGKKKRSLQSLNKNKNEIWEMDMSVFIKVSDIDNNFLQNEGNKNFILKKYLNLLYLLTLTRFITYLTYRLINFFLKNDL